MIFIEIYYLIMKSLLKVSFASVVLLSVLPLISCQKDSFQEVEKSLQDSIPVAKVEQTRSSYNLSPFFDADLSTRKNLSAYQKTASAFSAMIINPGRMKIVSDPVFGSKRKVLLMDVKRGDNAGVTENPRAQVQTPMQYHEGQDVWIGFSVYFPRTIWTYFLTFSELYGAPYQGSSPFRLGIQESNVIIDYNKKTQWKQPMQAGKWYDFVYHEVLSKNASKGLAQAYMRIQGASKFTEILKPTHMATITSANFEGPQYHKLACYYDKDNTYTNDSRKSHVNNVQVYFTNHKVGSNFNEVAPAYLHK